MGPTRTPYGNALGFVNNFNYRGTTAGLFAQGDTTPDVTYGSLFYANNTQDTVITHFDLQDYANRASEYEGKLITVFFLDDSSRLANGGRMFLAGSDDLLGQNHSITLIHSRSGWREIDRSRPNQNSGFVTATIAGTAALTVNRDTNIVYAIGTASPVVIAGISGPSYIGQRLTLSFNSQGISYQLKTDANVAIAGTNALLYTAPRAIELIRVAGSWMLYKSDI